MNAVRIRKKLESPIPELPELAPLIGKNVEIIATEEQSAESAAPALTSFDALASKLPGDPFGSDFDDTLRQWRQEPWRADDLGGE
jgi:hypothetical protein